MTTMAEFFHINRYDIHEHEVQAFIRKGGEVNTLLTDIAKDAKRFKYLRLIGGGHIRSGRLIGGLNHRQAIDTGPLQAASRISSSAKHTTYFMYDTGPVITAKGPQGFLLVPRYNKKQPQMSPASKGAGSELFMSWKAAGKPQARPWKRRTEVRGYAGIPFMMDARDAAFIKHGLTLR
jgi:hypothetical protein